jgi:hypothetical protein
MSRFKRTSVFFAFSLVALALFQRWNLQEAYAWIARSPELAILCGILYIKVQPMAVFGLSGAYRAASLLPLFGLLLLLNAKSPLLLFFPLLAVLFLTLVVAASWLDQRAKARQPLNES